MESNSIILCRVQLNYSLSHAAGTLSPSSGEIRDDTKSRRGHMRHYIRAQLRAVHPLQHGRAEVCRRRRVRERHVAVEVRTA